MFLYLQSSLVWEGNDDIYNSYKLTNDFDQPESSIMNFSDSKIMHVLSFNLYRDEVIDDKIYNELAADKQALNTNNLDNYLEIFYASRHKDVIND